jgi:hypothetical protein
MAAKRTKGKKVGKAPSAKRKTPKAARKATGKVVAKARKPASETTAAKRGSLGSLDLLRSWSPSRYSTR